RCRSTVPASPSPSQNGASNGSIIAITKQALRSEPSPLSLRPRPRHDPPASGALLERDGERRILLLDRFSLLLEVVLRGNDDIRTVAGDVEVPGLAERDGAGSDALLLRVGVEVRRPLGAGSRAVPFIGRELVDDRRLVGARRHGSLHVAFVEAVDKLMNGGHHVGLVLRRGRR